MPAPLSADLFKIQFSDSPSDFLFNGFSDDGCNISGASETLACQFDSNFSCLLRNWFELNMFSKKKIIRKIKKSISTP